MQVWTVLLLMIKCSSKQFIGTAVL